jgi:Tol biopolymer transport system component
MSVCVWDLLKQATARCLLEDVSDYMQAIWSPSHTNYLAYRRWDRARDREFLTLTIVDSGAKLYETDLMQADKGIEERFLAWHPDGKQILLAVDDGVEQQAVIVDVTSQTRQLLAKFDGSNEYLATGLWLDNGKDVLLSTIEPDMCCNAEFIPDARSIYRVKADGSEFKAIVVDQNIARYLYAPVRQQLLIKTYGTEPSPIYWVDLQSGKLTRVFDDEFEDRSPILFGITPNNRYIVLHDGQYQTWLFDTETEQLTQSPMEIYDTIHWRP